MSRTPLAIVGGLVFFVVLGLRTEVSRADDAPSAETRPEEAQGGKDHPGFKRFPGSVLTSYEHKAFEEHDLRVAFADGDFKTKKVEGKYWSLGYWFPKETGATEIFRNYEAAAKSAGFKIVLSYGTAATDRFLTAELDGPAPNWFSLRVYQTNDNQLAEIYIVEAKAMEQKVSIDAAGMLEALNKSGRIAVYGVNFATSSAKIGPDSAKVLEQIGKLLSDNKELTLGIEGHTDNVGAAKANLKLSKARAASVMKWLVKKHDVAAARLQSTGFGGDKPVESNTTDEGRAKNRRVELVKR